MPFASCQMGGLNMASPDVCLTPMGTSVPPLPYPNIAQGAMANPGTAVQKVLISGAPAHTLQTIIPSTSGDEAGVCGGVMSGSIMGPSRHLMGASNVLIGGHPATKMTDQTGQNGTSQNVSGSTMSPAQTKVMINSGGSSGGRHASSQEADDAQEKKKPVKLAVKNPRWEHADQNAAETRSESALLGDKVVLKADVTNVTDGTSILFKVFDTAASPPQQIATIVGHVTSGLGSSEWQVKKLTKLEFEAKLSPDAQLALLDVIPNDTTSLTTSMELVRTTRALVASGGIKQLRDATIRVGGYTAGAVDFQNDLLRRFPLIIASVLGVTAIMLAIAFRSVLVPLKAIVMNSLSVIATFGLTVLVFQ